MYDYKVSVRNYLDDACRQFSLAHNVTDLAKKVGMQPATLRNKLNPDQSHQLTLPELLAIIDLTEDPTILDGLLRQVNCQPSVPVNNARPKNMQFCALTAVASVGVIAGEAGGYSAGVQPVHCRWQYDDCSCDPVTASGRGGKRPARDKGAAERRQHDNHLDAAKPYHWSAAAENTGTAAG